MDTSLLIQARGGKQVKFSSPNTAQVFGSFGELLYKDAEVIYSGIDRSKAWKMLCQPNSFLIDFETNPKGQHFIIIGPYGLKGGGLCMCKSSTEKPSASQAPLSGNKQLNSLKQKVNDDLSAKTYSSLSKEQRDFQYEISESLELLAAGAEKGVIEDIVSSLQSLRKISLGNHATPIASSITLLNCLEKEGIWEQSSWSDVRREIANMARKLLFFAYHKATDKVGFFETHKGELSELVKSIAHRILEEESNFPENGLLCDIKAIRAIINLMKTDERWYVGLISHGKNLIEVVVEKNVESGLELLKSILENLRDALQYNLSINSLVLDYLRELAKTDGEAYDLLFSFLQKHKGSKWKLLYIILDEIERVILDKNVDTNIRKTFLEGDKKQGWLGFLDFASFNGYWISDRLWGDNWRIREKVASGLAKISECDNNTFKKKATDIIADRMVLESDRRVREILSNPESVQSAKAVLEATWDRRKDRYERALDEQKEILQQLEMQLRSSQGGKDYDEIVEGLREQRKCMAFQIDKISELGTKFGKEMSFLDKYESSTTEIKEKVDSLISETSELWKKFDRKFSTVMHRIDDKQSLQNSHIGNLCKIPLQNQNFVGRTKEIKAIRAMIPPRKKRTVTQIAIVGMGGVGKSQVAVEFANEYQDDFGLIWWIDAGGKSQIEASYMEIAEAMGILSPNSRQDEIAKQIILTLTRETTPWLLIFDNALNPKLVSDFIPSGQGVALITSRNPNWDNVYQLSPLSREDSVKLLQTSTNFNDKANANLIADELGDLPLALSQAGAFMKQTRTSYTEYLNLLKTQDQAVLRVGDNEAASVTWSINLTEIGQQNKDALLWIEGIAHLGSTPIPTEFSKEFFINAARKGDVMKYKQALSLIAAFSLIELDDEGNVTMHKIIQAVVKEKYKLSSQAMRGLEAAFTSIFTYNSEQFDKLEFYRKLAPHLQSYLKLTTLKTEQTAELLNLIGLFSLEIEQNPTAAEDFLHEALKLKSELFGKNSLEVAKVYNNLGNAYFEDKDLTQAIQNYKRALDLKIKCLGARKLEVAYSYNNLGLAYSEKKEMGEAVKCISKAYEIMEKNLGEGSVEVTTPLVNLGVAYDEMKNYALASKFLTQALGIRTEKLGDNHPDVADCLLNIGVLEKHKGNLTEARKVIMKAIKILSDSYGRDHPYSKNARDQLALLNRQ